MSTYCIILKICTGFPLANYIIDITSSNYNTKDEAIKFGFDECDLKAFHIKNYMWKRYFLQTNSDLHQVFRNRDCKCCIC